MSVRSPLPSLLHCHSKFDGLFRRQADRPGIGKSSLTVQYVENHFVESYYPTIENNFSKHTKIKNQEYSIEIIDTAGQVVISSPLLMIITDGP